MNKIIHILLFFAISLTGFSQEEKEYRFTHTLTESVGLFYNYDNLFGKEYSFSVWEKYGLINLIPSYELGYNNMLFAKVKVRNFEYYKGSTTEFNDYPNNLKLIKDESNRNAFSLVLGYNFLKKNPKHSLRLGAGLSCLRSYSKEELVYPNRTDSHKVVQYKYLLNLELSYRYMISKHFGIGAEFENYGVTSSKYFLNGTLSYTF
ncbi:MAG: hypothetical protein H6Q15_2009 [Bacteroidetes bacterium]|nr:hypothetical protein [Bacteroidota bacterium]